MAPRATALPGPCVPATSVLGQPAARLFVVHCWSAAEASGSPCGASAMRSSTTWHSWRSSRHTTFCLDAGLIWTPGCSTIVLTASSAFLKASDERAASSCLSSWVPYSWLGKLIRAANNWPANRQQNGHSHHAIVLSHHHDQLASQLASQLATHPPFQTGPQPLGAGLVMTECGPIPFGKQGPQGRRAPACMINYVSCHAQVKTVPCKLRKRAAHASMSSS